MKNKQYESQRMLNSPDALLYILGIVLIFLVLREILCWYWKINKIISTLEATTKLNEKLTEIQMISNEKLESICEELIMLRQQQLELSIKQNKVYEDDFDE
ncbi:hypothetical protein AAFN46_20515 [Pseudomonas sp. CAU 1711]|uniref:hypothetical protein n=1 Tax=Pseudomonas sp. CAU 1711 TaxID=3140356 RepID=UPI003260507B